MQPWINIHIPNNALRYASMDKLVLMSSFIFLLGIITCILLHSAFFSSEVNEKKVSIEKNKKRWHTCVITRVRNVPKLIPEWIKYHLVNCLCSIRDSFYYLIIQAIGVERFFIADDCSSGRNTTKVLQPFSHEDKVKIFFQKQLNYLNCSDFRPDESRHFSFLFQYSQPMCEWIAAIDVDEYIFPLENPREVKFLPDLLRHHDLVRMPWYLMSSHGHEVREPGLIVERFTEGVMNQHIKTFAKSSLISDWRSSHYPMFIDRKLRFAQHPFVYDWEMNMSLPCPKPMASPLILKHFQSLSWEEYMELRGSRNVTSDNKPNMW
jgi:hypothetical protein